MGAVMSPHKANAAVQYAPIKQAAAFRLMGVPASSLFTSQIPILNCMDIAVDERRKRTLSDVKSAANALDELQAR
jgi:hypothetical protein